LFRQPNYERKAITIEFRCRDVKGEWVFFSAIGTNLLREPLVEAIVVNMQDISTKRLTEKQLNYQHNILSKIQEAVIGIDSKFNVTYLNEAAEKLYSTKFDLQKNQPLSSLFLVGWTTESQQKAAFEEIQTKGYWQGEVTHITHIGKQLQVDIVVQRLIYQSNSSQEYLAIVRDISERKMVEVGLRQSEIRFKNLVESLSDLVWEIDAEGKFTYISPALEKLLGYQPEELIGKPPTVLMSAAEAARTRPIFDAIKKSKKSFSYILVEHLHKDGRTITIELSGVPVYNTDNEWLGYQGIMHDVTQRQQSEITIRNSLKEKETLIKEIHHRVKNNMQVISSLLLLQSQQIQDEKVLELYKESQMRIKSMALVHEKLYQSPDLSRIEFIGYIRSLTHVLASANRNANVQLQVETLSNEIYLSIDIAIPCGLIINELVSNAYKHAFPHSRKGIIKVALNFQEKNNNYALVISDDGIGVNVPEQKTSSLGLHLVKALTTQINGQFRYYNDAGAVFEILFKDKN
jgi:PAS domain S-box-containing protein